MDLCITKSLTIPECSHITSKSAQFYQVSVYNKIFNRILIIQKKILKILD
jgi:hypothetical protein